jgi:putative pyruvate formate lyase activating enzyme
MNAAEKIALIEKALARLKTHETACRLCPRGCGVNRAAGEKGFCESGPLAIVSHALLHYGEEPVISGRAESEETVRGREQTPGSGTIFFAGCNLKCLFCQNYQLSWHGRGKEAGDDMLSGMMLKLQTDGALNINLVSPTHLLLPILRALRLAYRNGLGIPLVYNSNGYEKSETVALLDGIIDIYLPDLKYFAPEVSARYSGAPDYFSFAGPALKEMYMQRPALRLDDREIAREGLIVRHLALPGQTRDSRALLGWLAGHLSPAVPLSLMSQYHPCFQAPEEMQRPLRPEEYREVFRRAKELGFDTMFVQPGTFSPDEHLVPDFDLAEPFSWKGKRRQGPA